MMTSVLEPMTDTPAASTRLLSAGPAAPGQEAAWTQFTKIPMPTRTDERWRFANVKDLDLSAYMPSAPVDETAREELLARSCGLEKSAGRMVFANDQLLTREAYSDELSRIGVIWLPLEQAMIEYPELFQQYFMREEAILGGQKFAALHASQVRTGTFLFVPRGVEINLPI
jgi:Fe-S cluster assembly protein SufD